MIIIDVLISRVFLTVAITMAVCEVWKFIDSSVRKKKLDWSALVATGGMPSSHATFVVSIAVAAGLVEGFASTVFFVAAGLAIVVVRDAFGVRRDVDKLAKTVNSIIDEKKLGIEEIMKITGHTPVQVVIGCIVGIVIPVVLNSFF